MIPLDLTHEVLADKEVQQNLLAGNASTTSLAASHLGQVNLRVLFHEILLFFAHTYSDVFGLTKGPPLHDPIAVAVLLNEMRDIPLFDDRKGERWHVNVVTDGLHSDLDNERGQVGRTVVKQAERGGVRIPRGIDVRRFWAILENCMQRAENL